MFVRIDEFEAPSHFTMEDLKMRVKGWLRSFVGEGYVFKAVSEHHITLTKTKHDSKICGISCVLTFLVPFLVIFSFPFSYPYSYSGVMALMAILILSIGGMMVLGIGWYCLKPQKVEFAVEFSYEMPIVIRVSGEGEITKARHDYNTLRDAFFRDSAPTSTRMDNW